MLFLHAEDDNPLLVKVGLAHAQFETVHPFPDGNGRVGRLLITCLLCASQALEDPVPYLSHYFRRHRKRYSGRSRNRRFRYQQDVALFDDGPGGT